jgi:hypothetical protein
MSSRNDGRPRIRHTPLLSVLLLRRRLDQGDDDAALCLLLSPCCTIRLTSQSSGVLAIDRLRAWKLPGSWWAGELDGHVRNTWIEADSGSLELP